jgi:hypothetical protein
MSTKTFFNNLELRTSAQLPDAAATASWKPAEGKGDGFIFYGDKW